MRALVFLFAFFLAGCFSGCVPQTSFLSDARGDVAAADGQLAMRRTVIVKTAVFFVDPETEKPIHVSQMGTGVVAGHRNGHTLVMTAAHVCAANPKIVKMVKGKEVEVEMSVTINAVEDLDLKDHFSRIIYAGKPPENDVCFLDADGIFGEVTAFAALPPPAGAPVIYAGAPNAAYDLHSVWVVDGRYCGRQHFGDGEHILDTYSLPGHPGASGGGIYYRGELVGIMVMIGKTNTHISYSVELPNILEAFAEARRRWKP